MNCREKLIKTVEMAIQGRGQMPVLQKYLQDTYGTASLAGLSEPHLERALDFVAVLEKQASPRQLMPVVPGVRAKGQACWFDGELDWS